MVQIVTLCSRNVIIYFERQGTLCKYDTACVDTTQDLTTRNVSSTGYFLLINTDCTVPFFFSIVTAYFFLPWHGMLPDAAAMEFRTPDGLTVGNILFLSECGSTIWDLQVRFLFNS